jgi:beta-N-acetylhexosaminidase
MFKEFSTKNFLFSFSLLILFSFFPSVLNNGIDDIELQSKEEIKYPSVFPLTNEDEDWIESNLAKMTTREKCAQMIVPWVFGKDYSNDSLGLARMTHFVKDLKVGGLLFSSGDVFNEAIDINKMQKIADIPLLISADFESGLGMRLSDGTGFPYNMGVAATGDPEFAFEMAKVISAESRAIGVFQNYAPVADINNNADNPVIGIRAYSEDKNIVAKYAGEFIRGSRQIGIITTAKHFPGHGNTKIDSHIDLPVIEGDSTYLFNNEIYPFKRAINNDVQSIMVGHLVVPALEDNDSLPATLSYKIVTDLLKQKLGFDGLIITDAMNMQALTKYFPEDTAAVMAVKAGNDILIMPPHVETTINALVDAVQSGEIDIQRINESVRKILAAKRWLQLQNNKISNIDDIWEKIATKSSLALASKIADKSITLVKNTRRVIPIKSGRFEKVLSVAFSSGIDEDSTLAFQEGIKENFKKTKIYMLNKKSKTREYDRILRDARKSKLILVPYYMRPPSDEDSQKLFIKFKKVIDKLLVSRAPVVLISFGDPYLLSRYSNAKTYLSAFSDAPVSQKSMLKALFGKIDISGELPISIPNTLYRRGYGIKLNKLDRTGESF